MRLKVCQCECDCVFDCCLILTLIPPFILLVCYVTPPIFHFSVPGQRKGSIFLLSSPLSLLPPCQVPLIRQFKRIRASLSLLRPYYFHLFNTIRLSLQGRERRQTGDHVVLITKKFIFPHCAGWGMSYRFTAGEVLYL